MSACMMTSRTRLAMNSVQLFIQRVFLNLEKDDVVFDDSARREWNWMKTYRIWEANRKVFLYPENWIEPELRDDKTPLFERLETTLAQGEVTDKRVEEGFLGYLRGLHEVAHLQVVGTYHQLDEDAGLDTVHVVARTRDLAAKYFYRQRVQDAYWTPWEEIPLDIDTGKVAPVVYGNRLFLFWATPVEKQWEDRTKDYFGETCYKVRISWTERADGKWLPKRTTEESRRETNPWGEYLPDSQQPERIAIRAYPGGFMQDTSALCVEVEYDSIEYLPK